MKKIFKYKLSISNENKISMPRQSEILSVHTQNDEPCIWALVDESMIDENVIIEIYGTGHTIDEDYEREFIGTFLTSGDNLVFHVFKRLYSL